ncbi:MAG: response regulator transcription factor [bacterium]|nr:response regulator transcription factor [bacterium]
MKYQCLIVDDDKLIAESTAEYFNMFDVCTGFVLDFDSAVRFLDENEVSLVLLDINLDDRSGFELCKLIRKKYDMPILFISARTSDDDVLTALNIGGDDYIKKPYTLNILLAKVKAILKRYEAQVSHLNHATVGIDKNESEKICIRDDLYLDTKSYRLLNGSQTVMLKSMEYKLLLYLLQNRNRVVTKDELFGNVWDDNFVGEGTLAVHIRHLREKIEIDATKPELIKTVWGVGYIIEEFTDEKI